MLIRDILIFFSGILFIYLLCIVNCYYYQDFHLVIKSFEGSRKQRRFFVPGFLRKPNEDEFRITYTGFVCSLIVLLPLIILVPTIAILYFNEKPLSVKLFLWWLYASGSIGMFTTLLSFIDLLLLSIYRLISKFRR